MQLYKATGPGITGTTRASADGAMASGKVVAAQSDQPSVADDPVRIEASAVIEPDVAPAVQMTVGEYLAQYWGERWPEMRLKLLEECTQNRGQPDCLEEKLDSVPPPWEIALPEIQQYASGEEYLRVSTHPFIDDIGVKSTDLELRARFKLPTSLQLGPQALAAVDGIRARYAAQSEPEIARYRTELGHALQSSLASGRYMRGPFFLPTTPSMESTHTFTMQHWCVRIELRRDEYPALTETTAVLSSSRQAREQEIKIYLESLK